MLRPRMLVALVVAGAGLATAIWLPTRNDTAAASDRDRDRGYHQSRDNDRDDKNRDNDRRDNDGWDNDRRDRDSPPPTAPPVTEPTAEPTTAPPTTAPPSTEPTTAPTTAPPAVAAAWKPFIDYSEGDLVIYHKVEYRVLQAHTSLPDWEPPAVPAVFTPLL